MSQETTICNVFKETILTHIQNKNMEELKSLLAIAEEIEILHALNDLSPEDQVIVFRLLAKDHALRIFEELDTDLQQNLLRSFTDERVNEFVNEMAPDDRVKLLDELPAGVAKKLINSLSAEERATTNILMGYKPETAGRIMTTEYISLQKTMTLEQALEKVSAQAQDKETIYTLFVTDNAKKLEGVLSLKDLIIARGVSAKTSIEQIMTKHVISVSTDTDQEEVARTLQELDLLAIPVVDKENLLVGMVTIDDAIDILEEEATEDIFDAAGFADITGSESDRSKVLTKGNLARIWAVRLPFLLITLAAGMAAALIVDGFEEILENVVVVAFFIPLIMDMGGNVGTQSSTVFARGVVLGHINVKQFLQPFLKELGVGFSMGSMMGIVSWAIISLWLGMPMLGIAVGLALVATMTLAAALGFLVPFTLLKLKVDQAAGSAPVITSIKDISGLFIYFGLVVLLMGSYLYAEPDYQITGMYATVGGINYFIDPEAETATVLNQDLYQLEVSIPATITIDDIDFTVTGTGGSESRSIDTNPDDTTFLEETTFQNLVSETENTH